MNERIISLALPAGTVLRRGSDRYILGEVVSFGGSSLFYTAKKVGSALRFGIKECCPMDLADRLRRKGSILTGTDDQAKYALTQARARMLGEAEISQKVASVSAKTIPVWEASGDLTVETAAGSAPAPAGSFLILRDVSRTGMFLPQLLAECALPPEEGHPLRTGGRPSLHTTARILAETLRALELVYQAGYLYGDVQPGNIFFADARPEKGDIGFVCLLDFGCARPLRARKGGGKETAPITDRMVFSTPGYTAPEITWYNDGTLRLTPAADVYSAGRLLLFLLRGRTYFENGRDRMLAEGVILLRLLPHEGEQLGCTGESLRLLQSLLDWSLALDPDNRYETAGEMLPEAEKLVELTQPPKNRLTLSCPALPDEEFLPRDEQLAEIDCCLYQRRKPAVVWGFAGMGKTELVLKFAQKYTRGKAYFVRFRDSVRQTVTGPIADAFSGYDRRDVHGREKPEEQIYREVMKLLGERSENDLLILDNMDGDEGGFDVLRGEPAFRDLCALPMGLLVTTRSPAEGGVEVDTLPLPLLRQLLRRFAPDLSDEMADALINAVEGHTLTVELIGRTLKTSIPRLSPKVLLEKLTQGDLDSKALAKVSSPKDREGRMESIQGHLTALFRLSNLPVEEQVMLCYALPIPPEGLAADDFAQIPDFDQDVLLRLIDRGWIRRSKDDILTLHPLVQETGWREVKAESYYPLFLFADEQQSGLVKPDYGAVSNASYEELSRWIGYLERVAAHSDELDTYAMSVWTVLELLEAQGRFPSSLKRAKQLVKRLETWEDPEAEDLPHYLGHAHFHCYYGYTMLQEQEKATLHYKAYQQLAGGEEQSAPTSARTEWKRRTEAFRNACQEKRFLDAVRLGEEARQWGIDNGYDTVELAFMLWFIYDTVGNREKARQLMQAVRDEMAQWKEPAIDRFVCLVDLAERFARRRPEESRALCAKALDLAGQMHPEARHTAIRYAGANVRRLLLDNGWEKEYVTWQKLVTELENEIGSDEPDC